MADFSRPLDDDAPINVEEFCARATAHEAKGELEAAEALCQAINLRQSDCAQSWRILAKIARRRGDRPAALALFETARRADPANPYLAYDLAEELRDHGRLDDAEALFAQLTEIHADFVHGWRGRALLAVRRGDRAAALPFFENVYRLAPGHAAFALEVAEALREHKRFDAAEEIFARLTARADASAAAWRGRGATARARGDREAAARHYGEAHKLAPDNPWIAFDRAESLSEIGRLDEAETAFARLTAMRPDFLPAWRGRAAVAGRRGDVAAAIAHLSAAQQLAPNDRAIALDRGHLLRQCQSFDQAEAQFAELAERHPQWSPARRGLGLVARQRGDRAAALAHFEIARGLDSKDPWIIVDLSQELSELGRLDEAETAFALLTATRPDFVHGWRGRAELAVKRGQFSAAADHFRAARELAPEDKAIALAYGHMLRQARRHDDAEAQFRDLAARHPHWSPPWRGLGLVARQRGDRAAALGHFEAARRRDPQDPWTIVDLGHELREVGRLDEAETAFAELTQSQPAFVHGWRGRAEVAGRRGDFIGAIDHLRAAQELAPADRSIALAMGHMLRQAKRFDEAQAAFEDLAARHPQWSAPWRGLGLIARQCGDRVAARQSFAAARAADPADAWAAVDLAHELTELGAIDQAESCLAELTRLQPDFAHGWRGLGMLARDKGLPDQALAHFRRAAALEPFALGHKLDAIGALRAAGRRDQARAEAKSLAEAEPQSAMALIAYAETLKGDAPQDQLIALYRRAVALEPNLGPARAMLGNFCLETGALDEAEEIFDTILAQTPQDIAALLGKSRSLKRRGDKAGALHWLGLAFAGSRSNAGVAQELALALAADGQGDEAERILAQAAASRDDSPSIEKCRGHLARLIGDSAAARAHFAAAVAQAPDLAAAQIELAEEDFRLGQVEAAIERLRALHEARPYYAPALERLADFCSRLDDLHGALELRRRVFELDPGNYRHLLEIARLAHALGRTKDALESVDAAQSRFGLNPDIALRRSEILYHKGDQALALDVIAEARRRWPGDFEIAMRSAWLAIETGAFDEAEHLLTSRAERGPCDRGRVAAMLGQLRAAQWRPDEGFACFLRAIELDPANGGNDEWAARMALACADVAAADHHLRMSTRKDSIHLVRHGGLAKPSQSHVGQLLDEYRIDSEALEGLRAARGRPDEVEALAALTRDFPDYTPAAMAFLVALRRRGDFTPAATAEEARPSPIPRQIFQYWDKDIPDDVAALCDSWRVQNPAFAYRRFSLPEARFYLQQLAPAARLAFDRAREPAMKADVFRLALLWREGGFYADADDRCLSGLDQLTPPGAELALYQEDYGTVGNNFIAAAPRHPALRAALEAAVNAINRGDSDIVWLATGPGLLTRCVAAFLAQDVEALRTKIRIHERHELRRAIAQHCPASYKHDSRHWSRSSFNASSAYRRSLQALAGVAERALSAPSTD